MKIGDIIKVIAPWGKEIEVEIFSFYTTKTDIWAEYQTDTFPSKEWEFEKGCKRVAAKQ